MTNKKYYLTGALVLITGIIIYHYFAASQAEQQIEEALQKYSASEKRISISHSSIDITPFWADVTIENLAVIFGSHIERSKEISLDIDYLDFLNIYFAGPEYALKKLNTATLTAISPSYTNRKKRQELKTDTLIINYNGNAFDALNNAINGVPFENKQSVKIKSQNFALSLPGTELSKVNTQNLEYTGEVRSASTSFWLDGNHHIRLDSLTWTPEESFQNKYSFFIKGLGYNIDAIPFQHGEFKSQAVSNGDTLKMNAHLKSELALLSASGVINIKKPFLNSQFSDTNLSLSEFSDRFNNILSNIEQLLGTSLSKENGTLTFTLTGTLADPKIMQ